MWLLLALSIVVLAVSIERFIALGRAGINVNEFLAKLRTALLANRSIREAIKVCEQYRGPVASIMKAGLLKYGSSKDDIETTIENAALFERARLERFLPVLSTIAMVAPLLGFLGTAINLIQSSDAQQAAGLGAALGIEGALVPTAAGLMIAIPTLIVYTWFRSRINKFGRDLETATNMLLGTLAEMDGSGGQPAEAGTATGSTREVPSR
jgi:biopolymer transport protein ExbB